MPRPLHFLVIFQTLLSVLPKLEYLPHDERLIRRSLTSCVVNAAERFFPEGHTIFYSLPLSEVADDLVSASVLERTIFAGLSDKSKWALTVKNASLAQTEPTSVVHKPQNYIIQMRNLDEFFENVDILKSSDTWNPHAKFLIVSPTIVDQPRHVATLIVKKLWKIHVINGIILLTGYTNNTSFNVYGWYPYRGGNCGDDFDKVTRIDTCSFGNSNDSVDWYPDKVPRKFNDCPVDVRMVRWPPYIINVANNSWSNTTGAGFDRGLEVNLLDLIAELYDLRMLYYYSREEMNWGDICSNGTLTGNMKYLYDEIDDVSLGGFAKTMQRATYFDDTFYHYESLRLCVPFTRILVNNKLESLLEVLKPGAVVVTVLVYSSLTALMWFNSNGDVRYYKNAVTCIMSNFSALLGLPVFAQPRTSRVRFFMAMLLVYSFCIVTAYQTLMTSAMANVKYRQKIRTIQNVLDSKMDIYGLPTTLRYFTTDGSNTTTNMVNKAILHRWRNCSDTRECLKLVAVEKTAAVCFPRLFTEYIQNSYVNANNEPLMYCFKKPLVSYPLTILMRKGFPLSPKFNVWIIRILSSGFVKKWTRDILRTRYENFNSSVVADTGPSNELDFGSLKPVFFIWVVGCSLATLAFLIEHFLSKITRRVNQ